MRVPSLSILSDEVLLRELKLLVARERETTATLLAHIAEVDDRRLYAAAGYPSMFAYCVEKLGFSEDAAYNRIFVARAAREYPQLLDAIADGRIHLTAARLIIPHLTSANLDEVLAEAGALKRKSEIEMWLARRFPAPEPPLLAATNAPGLRALAPSDRLASARVSPLDQLVPEQVEVNSAEPAPDHLESANATATDSNATTLLLPPIEAHSVPGRITTTTERFHLHVRLGRATHQKLQYAQALLSHTIPSGDVELVLDRALDALIATLEKRKFGATGRPRRAANRKAAAATTALRSKVDAPPRPIRRMHVPAAVRREVWKRDGGRCTFTGESGHRCRTRRLLEYDHIEPVARGGATTVEGLRLRCRAHNQYEAERVFGRAFMRMKRALLRRVSGPASEGHGSDPPPVITTQERGEFGRPTETPAP